MRGCLTLVLGFLLGAGIMLYLWPHQPRGVVVPARNALTVMISDAFLTREVQSRVSGQTVPQVSNVRISSIPPSALLVNADVGVGPITAAASTELQPVVAGGQVQVNVVSSNLAGIPIPTQLTGFVQDAINSHTQNLLGSHTRVTGVQVRPSGLEIEAGYR